MEKYYFIREDESKTGVPVILEAGIYEQFIEKEKYIKDYTFPPAENPTPDWYRPITKGNCLSGRHSISFITPTEIRSDGKTRHLAD